MQYDSFDKLVSNNKSFYFFRVAYCYETSCSMWKNPNVSNDVGYIVFRAIVYTGIFCYEIP